MAKRKSPTELREQAQKLMEEAKKIESDRKQKIGDLVVSYLAKNFQGFQQPQFVQEVKKIWEA